MIETSVMKELIRTNLKHRQLLKFLQKSWENHKMTKSKESQKNKKNNGELKVFSAMFTAQAFNKQETNKLVARRHEIKRLVEI